MKLRIKHGELVILICLLYILVSPINQLLPISLNRMLTLLFVAVELWFAFMIKGKASRAWILLVGYWCTISLIACLRGPLLTENISDFVYILHTVLILELTIHTQIIGDIVYYVRKKKQFVLNMMIITLIMIGITALMPESYEENGAFRGAMYNSHSMASTAILVISVVELCIDVHGKTMKIVFSKETVIILVCFAIILATKGRTFLIPAAVLLWRYLNMFPIKKNQKTFVAVIGFFLIIWLLWDPISEKFIEAMNNEYAKNKLAAITNFRSELWKCDFTNFAEQNWFLKLFGNGYSFVRELHEVKLKARLWSHNDFTYLLVATGIVGIVIYLGMYVRILRRICETRMHWIIYGAMVFFPMFVNGFYIYIALVWSFFLVRVSLYTNTQLTGGI